VLDSVSAEHLVLTEYRIQERGKQLGRFIYGIQVRAEGTAVH
jgi:hypothetical protein